MNQLDILYRAFVDYRRSTAEDEACKKFRQAVARASADKDKVESQRSLCTIEEDWVLAIETGLPYVEKAIHEERQFIRQHGEVVPIEKVRRVSKASVSHLARHGNLITRVPEEGEDIIPDQLYMVENLSNYAVYENRFLYMLLCYLRDFIDLRYNKIVELGNTYKASMTMAKNITMGKRTITYHTQFTEEYRGDPLSSLSPEVLAVIDRIENLQKIVSMLLNTPLMKEVSHAPMLKPPITRTNALRMDNNLRLSLALYDYVAAYTKQGYEVEIIRKTFNPLPEVMGDEFSEAVSLASFLVYEYSNDLKGRLKESYQEEEIRRRDEEAERQRLRLEAMRREIAESGGSPEAYMLMLQERNEYLEKIRVELDRANARILDMTAEQERLQGVIHDLEVRVQVHDGEMAALEARYEEKLTEMEEAHRAEIAEIELRKKQEIEETYATLIAQRNEMQADYESRLSEQKDGYETALREAGEKYETDMAAAEERRVTELTAVEEQRQTEVADLNELYDSTVKRYESSMLDMQEEYEEQITILGDRARDAENELAALRQQTLIQRAELRALRHMRGTDSNEEDFTSEERFNELVGELAALDAFVGTHWKKARRHIRHKYLWSDNREEREERDDRDDRENRENRENRDRDTDADRDEA